ncbi:MAG: 5-bromo-4-chloroindolyl phosphate hydrolysis family protein [Candidatus Eisenbacteria bacterium]|uniref:5-bromo-4-chloroindolyl phosphate hydrolysis family protein n=1 Tax=Eiseniibacteriota bacterium TaxID=2212470 RepID=A0A956NK01_UNCEI|nr:5-bromo-4-chloroindolyl phosphate hydrolysis family protein [Candidatus Eisenbacteria bacterium]
MAASRNLGYTLSGLIAGIVFLVFLIGLRVPLLFSLGTSVAAFLGSVLMLVPKEKKGIAIKVHDVSPESVARVMAEGKEKVKAIRSLAKKIGNKTLERRIESICKRMEQIYRNFERDPKDIKAAGQFLSYYTDTTVKIIERYIELSGHGVSDREIQSTLTKVESILGQIDSAFEKQLAKLLRDDALDLDSEIRLLEKTLEAEGLARSRRDGPPPLRGQEGDTTWAR